MLYDCHTHTQYSHDSTADPHDMCEAALARGMSGIALTDHCDLQWEIDVKTPILQSNRHAEKLAEEYAGRLRVLRGVELGEALWEPHKAADMVAACPYDVVIGSVHAVRFDGYTVPFSWIAFHQFSDKQIAAYVDAYLNDVLALVRQGGFDVLAHPLCALRYIVDKYGRSISLTTYRELLYAIADECAKRAVALEINTAAPWDEGLLRRYREQGGRYVTIGSDAHTPDRVGDRFQEAVALLRRVGFSEACYFEKRKVKMYSIEEETR